MSSEDEEDGQISKLEEEEEREEILAEVTDPAYIYSRADADADGEVDDTIVNGHVDNPSAPMDVSVNLTGEIEVNGQS